MCTEAVILMLHDVFWVLEKACTQSCVNLCMLSPAKARHVLVAPDSPTSPNIVSHHTPINTSGSKAVHAGAVQKVSWEQQVPGEALKQGGILVADEQPAFPMHWDSIAQFWQVKLLLCMLCTES